MNLDIHNFKLQIGSSMISKNDELGKLSTRNGFRLRSNSMTRLEAFSDAAFAFAMTMLVISVGNIPGNYEELLIALKGVPTFSASFASIMTFWMGHRAWSQRYGLEDSISTFLSLMLIFIVLVYLYPLKIVFATFFTWLSGGWLPSNFQILSEMEVIGVFVIYGLGLALLSGSLALLNFRALSLADKLRLNKLERTMTSSTIASWSVMTFTGLASAIFAWLTPANLSVYAGFVYWSLAVTMPVTTIHYKRKIKEIKQMTV